MKEKFEFYSGDMVAIYDAYHIPFFWSAVEKVCSSYVEVAGVRFSRSTGNFLSSSQIQGSDILVPWFRKINTGWSEMSTGLKQISKYIRPAEPETREANSEKVTIIDDLIINGLTAGFPTVRDVLSHIHKSVENVPGNAKVHAIECDPLNGDVELEVLYDRELTPEEMTKKYYLDVFRKRIQLESDAKIRSETIAKATDELAAIEDELNDLSPYGRQGVPNE